MLYVYCLHAAFFFMWLVSYFDGVEPYDALLAVALCQKPSWLLGAIVISFSIL